MDQKYYEYLQSDWWQKIRDDTIKKQGNKCFCCDRPFDLQVHHLTYEHLGFERDYELVVLCKSCHEWIEDHKRVHEGEKQWTRKPRQQIELLTLHREELKCGTKYKAKAKDELMEEFVQDYYFRDYSQLGDLNLTNLDVIKEEFPKFCEQKHYIYIEPRYTDIITFFSHRRYEVILRFKDNGAEMSDVIKQTKISKTMISKVWKESEIYKTILKREELKNAETTRI